MITEQNESILGAAGSFPPPKLHLSSPTTTPPHTPPPHTHPTKILRNVTPPPPPPPPHHPRHSRHPRSYTPEPGSEYARRGPPKDALGAKKGSAARAAEAEAAALARLPAAGYPPPVVSAMKTLDPDKVREGRVGCV